MLRRSRSRIHESTCLLTLCVATALPGCAAPSLLITPVTSRRALQETELSSDSFLARTKIALIDVSGILRNAPQRGLLSQGEHPVSLFLEQLDKARRDSSVKAVILRINSPGGSVVASELMHNEIMHFKKSKKPIMAVMMDVAASGGYYIACACDEIVAQPSTITGSIGVIMQLLNVAGTMKMIGVKSDAVTSGAFKAGGSPLKELQPEEREVFQRIVNDMYDRFIDVVVDGRPDLDEETIRRLADGRIYTAGQAAEAGLIDRIQTLREAVESIKKRIGASSVRLVTYHRPESYRPNYYASAPNPTTNQINLLNVDFSGWPGLTAPEFMYLWAPGRPSP